MLPRSLGSARAALTVAAASAAAVAVLGSCANLMLPPVEMGSAAASPACQETIGRVFASSGFEPVSMPGAPPMLFAPRMLPQLTFVPTLGWMVGVSFTGACDYHLQALSTEPDCMPTACIAPNVVDSALDRAPISEPLDRGCYRLDPTCPLSPTGGRQYTAALKELARRIDEAWARQQAATPKK